MKRTLSLGDIMIELFGIFKDNMVLQRDKEIRVFGCCEPGSNVSCGVMDGRRKKASGSAVAEEDGLFLIRIDPLPAGGPYKLRVSCGKEKVVLSDVYIGDVWLACGEDNMLMPLKMTETPVNASGAIKEDRLHFYRVPLADELDEEQAQAEADSSWVTVDPQNAGEMSGVAYYFSLELMKKVDCHIGIIGCYALNSGVASWQSRQALESTPEGRHMASDWDKEVSHITDAEYLREKEEYLRQYASWKKLYDRVAGRSPNEGYDILRKSSGDWPRRYPNGSFSYKRPGGLFEVMILRVFPVNLKGVIYYQGETDADDYSDDYAPVLGTLINEWRTLLDDSSLPFIICQLPMYVDRDRKFMGYEDYKWPHLRDEQYRVSKTRKDTYLAILSDCGEFDNLHPIDKKTPGRRLALLALKEVYGYNDVCATAPYITDVRKTNGGAEMSFAGDFKMLMLKSTGNSGFEISGMDGVFHPCRAAVDFDGRTVTALSPEVMDPVTVRYAYFSFGDTSLSSDTGLAVLPFSKNIVRNLSDD